jgi:sRNA-binding carbon storage regulator CsrA
MAITTTVPESLKKLSKKAAVAQARAELYNKIPKENFLAVEYDYNKSIVLPYDEGLRFVACLKNAEVLEEQYNKPKTITSFQSNYFKTRILSRKDYEDIKIAALLGITVEELNTEEELPADY